MKLYIKLLAVAVLLMAAERELSMAEIQDTIYEPNQQALFYGGFPQPEGDPGDPIGG